MGQEKTSIRFDEDFLENIDRRAKELGMNRSEYLRNCAAEEIYGSNSSEIPEDKGELSYQDSIRKGDIEVTHQASGFSSQEEMEKDRKEYFDDAKELIRDLESE